MSDWQSRTEAYKAAILSAIPEVWRLPPSFKVGSDVRHAAEASGILTPEEVKLLAQDATSLAARIASGEISSLEATTAYCKSAAVAHQTTGCIMDFFPEEALARALELDGLRAQGKIVGPLHGVPISIKDMCGIIGRRRSAGFLSYLASAEGRDKADATIVAALRAAGAVFFCKTTMPQAIMHLETHSFLGVTTNPFNTALTPGGSSGGEAALIAAGGSVLGVGSDIGGSIRNPCANCGLYGFKPTSLRLPRGGNVGGMPGQDSIPGAVGPMGVSARDMELFMRVILSSQPWRSDPSVARMPWRTEDVAFLGGKDKPRIGVLRHDGVCLPQPPMVRALDQAVTKLRAAGYDVVDVPPPPPGCSVTEGWALLRRLYFTDGGARVRNLAAASGEPILPLTEWVLSAAKDTPATELFELTIKRDNFRAAYNAYWNELGIDALLAPPYPGPAPQLGTSKYWMYTAMWNLVDYPGATFPTPWSVEADDVAKKREYLSDDDKMIAEFYSPDKFANAPLALQILTPRWEDEKCIEVLKLVSKVVNSI